MAKMKHAAPPADPGMYAYVVWPVYSRTSKAHWAYPAGPSYRTLCGQYQWRPDMAGPHIAACVRCAERYAKIKAQHDADHTMPVTDVV